MASTAERLQIIIDAQDRASKEIVGVQKQLQNVQKDVKTTTSSFSDASGSITSSLKGVALAVGGAFALHTIFDFGKELFNTAVKLDVIGKKSSVVFGAFKKDVEGVAEATAISMGMTTSEFLDAATSIGDLLVPMKFTRGESAKMSTDLVTLSGALSEWSGGKRSAEEVSHILSKAILGEREQLKELGISINEAQVQQVLLDNGQNDLTGSALEQAEAQATLKLIMEKSTDAQTAFANGGDSIIRTQNEMKATAKKYKEELVEKLTPAFEGIMGTISDVTEKFAGNKKIQEELVDAIGLVIGVLEAMILLLVDVVTAYRDAFLLIKSYITDTLWPAFQGMYDSIVGVFRDVYNDGMGYWNDLKDGISGVVGYIQDSVNTAIDAFNSLTGLGIGNIGGVDGARANGGPVRSGSTYLVGERGPELFVPRSSGSIVPNNSLGGVTVNLGGVTIANGRDERRFSSMLETELTRITRNLSLGVT